MPSILLALPLALAGFTAMETSDLPRTVLSPDQSIRVTVDESEDGGLRYRVDRGDQPVVGWSELGLRTRRAHPWIEATHPVADFSQTVTVENVQETRGTDAYTRPTGKRRENEAHWAGLTVAITDDELGHKAALDIRVYDDGFAFRHRLTDEEDVFTQVLEDTSGINVELAGRVFAQPYEVGELEGFAYEQRYADFAGLADVEVGTPLAFPALIAGDEAALLVTEADIGWYDHGSHLVRTSQGFGLGNPPASMGLGQGRTFPSGPTPWALPWRVGILGSDLAGVVESNLVSHLSAPSTLIDDSWVIPGVASWSWWADHASSRNLDALKDSIDLAQAFGWPYTLIDANWNTISPDALETLVAYADARGVRLFVWYNSGGAHNGVPEEPRNILDDTDRRRAEFRRLAELGVAGIKVDFFQSDKHDVFRLYQEILRDAGEARLMVNVHGSTLPRGWSRTYPHLVTYEAVQGGEFYTFGGNDYGAAAPRQNTILPFTRNVVGPMDYTPFNLTHRVSPRQTTLGHELANLVLFETAVQHVADSAASLRALPDDIKAFLTDLPTAWDDTRLLAGFPGQGVVLARRRGATWYVAGANGTAEPRAYDLDLGFLEGPVEITTYREAEADPAAWSTRTRRWAQAPQELRMSMPPFGGFVLKISPHTP
ncbi:MAG: glycoside hydrolase family 97 catalytic domain-containing protein [Brevundimonas sp.]